MSGENSRHYHSFKSEDFVGKMATLAVNCNKNQLEHVVLTRFYMGLLTLNNKFSLFSECGTAEGIKYLKKQSTNKAYFGKPLDLATYKFRVSGLISYVSCFISG